MYSKQPKALIAAAVLAILATAYGAGSIGAPAMDPPAAAAPATAAPAMLLGTQEVPPVQTKASASSSIAVAEDMSVTGSVITSDIESTTAHIHHGAVGVSGPVIVTLVKTTDTQWSVPADTKLTPEQYANYKAGELYVNVHSAAHKDGEIRMQLTP
jgi:hypothetical protein